MKKNLSPKGFTLIELLVVVAIIAILSGTILVALNSARSKAKDARVQAELQQLKSQLELYYTSNNNGYGTATNCSTPSANNPFVAAAGSNDAHVLIQGIDVDNGSGGVRCGASADQWAVSADLSTGGHLCVDSNGVTSTTTTADGETVCP